MGWFGWTEQQLGRTDLLAIRIAYAGRVEMLQAIFGTPDDEGKGANFKPLSPPPPQRPVTDNYGNVVPFTPAVFDDLFGSGRTT